MARQCRDCQEVNPDSNSFCAKCGNRIGIRTTIAPAANNNSRGGVIITALLSLAVLVSVGILAVVFLKNSSISSVATPTLGAAITENLPQPQITLAPTVALAITTLSQTSATSLPDPTATFVPPPPTATFVPPPTATPVLPPPTATPIPLRSERIAFAAPDDGEHWNIYTVKPDGNDVKLLIRQVADVISPAFSPDGQWIAYVLDYEKNRRQLRRVRVDGSDDIALTDDTTRNEYPSWSPDSKQIYFISNRNYGTGSTKTDSFVVDINGGAVRPFIQNAGITSQSGSFAVFTRFNGRNHDLMGYNSGTVYPLVTDDECDFGTISPDGQYVAFTRGWNNSRAIYITDRNGRYRRITPPGEIATNPVWSPDGKSIAYLVQGVTDSIWEINSVDVNTLRIQRVYTTGKAKFYISWGR